jgi:type II restriction enzyme
MLREINMRKPSVNLANGQKIRLFPRVQNVLVKKILDDFCPLFTPGSPVIYVGDTEKKWAFFDPKALASLGVDIQEHGKMPDVVVYHKEIGWFSLSLLRVMGP